MNRIFNEFNNQLQMAYEREDYTEIDLTHWKEQLMSIKKELETGLYVGIVPDNDLPPIYFYKLKTIKDDIIIQSLLSPSVTQSNDSFEMTNISDKKCLESQLNFYDIHKQSMCYLIKFI